VSGQPKTWADTRAVVLHRDGYRCQICKVADATDADHIWPRVAGGPDRLENLQAACGPCNKRKGGAYNVFFATEQQRRSRSRSRSGSHDPRVRRVVRRWPLRR
jgi:hypothetical protein